MLADEDTCAHTRLSHAFTEDPDGRGKDVALVQCLECGREWVTVRYPFGQPRRRPDEWPGRLETKDDR